MISKLIITASLATGLVLLQTASVIQTRENQHRSHDRVTVSRRAQHQDPETEEATVTGAVINVSIFICDTS